MALGSGRRRSIGKAARNERRKAGATTLNALSVALIIATIVQPLISHRFVFANTIAPVVVFLVAQAALHYLLGDVED